MEYLGPYNATDHARLVGMYFRGIGDQVVYAQSGSCLRYRNCATAEYRSLYGCGAFSSTTGCVERGDGGELGGEDFGRSPIEGFRGSRKKSMLGFGCHEESGGGDLSFDRRFWF